MREQEAERSRTTPQQPQSSPLESQVLPCCGRRWRPSRRASPSWKAGFWVPPRGAEAPSGPKGLLCGCGCSGTPAQKGTTEQAPYRGAERAAQPNPKAAKAVRAQRTPVPTAAPVPSAPVAATRLPKSTPSAAPTSPATESEWQVVGEKKKRRRAAKAAKKKAQRRWRRERAAAAQLCAPKTAAEVLTQQPDAVKRGVSYRDVLAKAKEAVSLAELGITEGLRLRVTTTGARMLELY
ncbi:nematocyst expressed protein 3-like [Helicoverpa armigera]|uniref:nematocyst expressed protein 3-like n=1 Tax=Helicoverpa armigera TaxID=29058 RepID=UPI0030828BB8